MKRARSVDEYINDAGVWKDELKRLRTILQSTDLEEDVKWGGPCYTYDGKNVVGMAGFRSYFGRLDAARSCGHMCFPTECRLLSISWYPSQCPRNRVARNLLPCK